MSPLSKIPYEVAIKAADMDVLIVLATREMFSDTPELFDDFAGCPYFLKQIADDGRAYDVIMHPLPLAGVVDALNRLEREFDGDVDAWAGFGMGW